MSALWRADPPLSAGRVLVPLTGAHLDAVMAIEKSSYAFPWTRGNFVDSVAAGHFMRVLLSAEGALWGYFVAMLGVDEMHLLNITVEPGLQGRGHARYMLGALVDLCREKQARELWLEVRESNARAQAIYLRAGFKNVGRRKGYYPAPNGSREDAVVMGLTIDRMLPEATHALE